MILEEFHHSLIGAKWDLKRRQKTKETAEVVTRTR